MNATDETYDPTAVYVTATKWSVSYTSGTTIANVILKVSDFDETQWNSFGGRGVVVRHPEHDGRQFATKGEAKAYALAAGLIKRYVSQLRP